MAAENAGDRWYPERLFPILVKKHDLLGRFERDELTPTHMAALVDMLRCKPAEIKQSLVEAKQRRAFAAVMKRLKEQNDASGITAKVLAYVRGKCSGKSTMKHMQSLLKTEHGVPDRDTQKLRQAQLVKMVSLTALALLSNRT